MIRIMGVPEHFNLGWMLADEAQDDESTDSNLEWCFISESRGSGAMTQALLQNECDVALLLTEAAARLRARDDSFIGIGRMTESGLNWGVHIAPEMEAIPQDTKDLRIGISRFGSGSHLMAKMMVHQEGLGRLREDNWRVVNNIDGAEAAFQKNEIDLFMWEEMMTRPLCRAGVMRQVETFTPPWHAFTAVCSREFFSRHEKDLSRLFGSACHHTQRLHGNDNELFTQCEKRFNLLPDDVEHWRAKNTVRPRLEDCTENLDQVQGLLRSFGALS